MSCKKYGYFAVLGIKFLKKYMKKILLSIAGFDPTSGAGVMLDISVFQYLGFYGMGILTSVTEQNTQGVKKFLCLPPECLWEQYKAIREDVDITGIKVGMVGSKNNIPVIEKILSEDTGIKKIIDPVFKSTSGKWLFDKDAVTKYTKKISGKASLITPNIEEAILISNIPVTSTDDMRKAAEIIYNLTGIPCLIKGGHLKSSTTDVLYDGKNIYTFKRERIDKMVHGTGCFLSSSILGYMVGDIPLKDACSLASRLTYKAIKKAIPLGQGQNLISFPLTGK